MNIYIVVAGVLAVIAAVLVILVPYWMRPRCPLCRGHEVSEREDGYICHDCGTKFLE